MLGSSHSSPKAEILRIEADDGVLLPALYFYEGGATGKELAVYIHGAGSSSLVRRPDQITALADVLAKSSIDTIAVSTRGIGYITKFDTKGGDRMLGGMVYESLPDFIHDAQGIVAWAVGRGYARIHFIGHSTGANKLVYWLSDYNDSHIGGVVLEGGGDDIALQRSRYSGNKLKNVYVAAEKHIKNGQGAQLVPPDMFPGDHPISWRSLHELLTDGGPYDMFPFVRAHANEKEAKTMFARLQRIPYPILFIYGENDPGTVISVERARQLLHNIRPDDTFVTLQGAEHTFAGYESEEATSIADWLHTL